MSQLGGRLGKLEATVAARNEAHGPALLMIDPNDWPTEDRDAFDAAGDAGDHCMRHDLIERHMGVRPGPATLVIVFRVRSDGAQ